VVPLRIDDDALFLIGIALAGVLLPEGFDIATDRLL